MDLIPTCKQRRVSNDEPLNGFVTIFDQRSKKYLEISKTKFLDKRERIKSFKNSGISKSAITKLVNCDFYYSDENSNDAPYFAKCLYCYELLELCEELDNYNIKSDGTESDEILSFEPLKIHSSNHCLNSKRYSDLLERQNCNICFDEKISIIFIPCGHYVACFECSIRLNECPVCRNYISSYIEPTIPKSITEFQTMQLKCKKCNDKKSILNLPCNHLTHCEECVSNNNDKCFICYEKVDKKLTIY